MGENKEKYITFSVPIKKELENDKIITYTKKFIDSSLSSLVNNLSEGLHRDKCTDCKSCLDYMVFKDDKLIFRRKELQNDFNKDLMKRLADLYEFRNEDVYLLITNFILLLRKGVYPDEYMDSSEILDETSFPDKEASYSSLNMEDIAEVDYRHAKRVLKYLKNKNLGDYHDLYVQSDTLFFADLFENFRIKYIEIYELAPVQFLSTLGLA